MKTTVLILCMFLGMISNIFAKDITYVYSNPETGSVNYQILPTTLFSNDVEGDMQITATCNSELDSATIVFSFNQSGAKPIDSLAIIVDGSIIRGNLSTVQTVKYNGSYMHTYTLQVSAQNFFTIFDAMKMPKILVCNKKKVLVYNCIKETWKELSKETAQLLGKAYNHDDSIAQKK